MRALLQHPYVMVGLEHEHVCGPGAFANEARDVTKVGGEADIAAAGAEHESNWILGIVRHGKGFDGDVADVEAAAADEQAEVHIGTERALDLIHRRAIAVDRDVQLFRNPNQPGDMIAVLVGDENGRQVFRCASDACEAKSNLAWTEPGIHQDARLVGFDVRSVTGGTATENREFDSHAETLTTVFKLDNAISHRVH